MKQNWSILLNVDPVLPSEASITAILISNGRKEVSYKYWLILHLLFTTIRVAEWINHL